MGFCASAAEAMRTEIERLKRNQQKLDSNVNAVTGNQSLPDRKFITPRINGMLTRLQVDSGSDITIIAANNWRKLGSPALSPARISPKSASGNSITLWGSFKCRMSINDNEEAGECYVASRLNLLGSEWMTKLGLWDVPLSMVCHQLKVDVKRDSLTQEAMTKFPKLFSEGLGCFNKTEASMTLKADAKPVFIKARPPPFAAMKPIEEEIMRGVHEGIYTSTEYSDFAAPIVVVKKKNGKIRLCGDYSTGLNDVLEPNKFPLPTSDQIFAGLTGCKVFSVIDLSDAFLQVPLDSNARKLLTINTHLGLFNVNRLQPGVKTAPGIFQENISKMLSGIKAFAFIDDIILGGEDEKEHRAILFEVLARIQENGFKLRVEKCQFGKLNIPFCGHILSEDGIRPNPEKTLEISNIPRPEDVHQVRSFLGAVNYYGKFVKNMMNLRGPLIELTIDGAEFKWGERQEKAFLDLRKIMESELVLTHYDPLKKIVVAADASAYGMGGAIMHEFPNGSLHPIIHVSKAFSAAQKNYSQIEKEAEALVFTVKRCHKYLFGRKFELHTDHKPLLTIFGSKKGIPVITASRLQRHALTLLAYDFDVKYVNTESFGYADMISRLISRHEKLPEDDIVIAQLEVQCFAIDTASTLPVKFSDIQAKTQECQVLSQVSSYIMHGWPQSRKAIVNSEVARFYDQREAFTLLSGCIFFGERIVIPAPLRPQILEELHRGHPGIVRMKLLARCKVFWPQIDKEIERTVRSCENCAKAGKSPIKCSLQPWPVPKSPWSRIHIDYAGPVDGMCFLVIVDAYSKWPEVFETKITTTSKTIELLSEVFTRHGYCDTIVSDNGPQFTSDQFANFCKSLGVEHIRTAPYHPQSNGQAERFVDLLKTGLKKAVGSVNERLREFLFSYRSTPSYNLGMKSPAEVLNARSMKSKLDLVKPSEHHSHQVHSTMAKQFDHHHGAKWKEFFIESDVYYQLHNSSASWQWVPAKIIKKIGKVNYEIKLASGRIVKAHANQLKVLHEVFDPCSTVELNEESTQIANQHSETPDKDVKLNESLNESDVFEDAQETEDEDKPTVPVERRQSTRSNFGVPPKRFVDEFKS